jgi:O-succinylbenzoate synthase
VQLLAGDVTDDSLLPVDGMLSVRRPPVSSDLLQRWSATHDRAAHWEDRLAGLGWKDALS